jgi:2-methylcitrate dehydratase PrpD
MSEGIGLSRRAALSGSAALAGAMSLGAISPARAGAPADAGEPIPVMAALTAYIADARGSRVPEAIRDRARLHLLDTLASIIACRDLEAAHLARRYARLASGGPHAASSILGSRERAGIIDAAFAGAMTGHGAEINDFIPSAYVQPGPSIGSALLALAEARGLNGRATLDAMIVGYELAGRIPKTIGTQNLQKAALANHGIGPVFGTGAAAACALGMTAAQVNHVLSYCAQQASGSWQWMLDVRHIEKSFVFAGMGGRNGLQAALMVEQGFTGVPDSFDVAGGWLRMAAFSGGDANRRYLIEDLGRRFELSETAFKRYPTGGPTQPAVEALLDLRQQVRANEVARIRIEMPGRADTFRDAAMPALNLPYLAAIIFLDGKLDFVAAQSLERMHGDPAVAAFRKRVQVIHDPAQEAAPGTPRTESARVTIERHEGPTLQRFVPFVRGFPSHPMSRADLEAKVTALVEPALGASKARELIARTTAIDEASDLKPLIALMRV